MNIQLKLLILLSIIFTFDAQAQLITDFKSDGCSRSPDAYWGVCCQEHDFLYWLGGSPSRRKKADLRLRSCMNELGGPGNIYYQAVRSLGAEHWGDAWGPIQKFEDFSPKGKAQTSNEQALWQSLGHPPDFDFKVYESLSFHRLTQADMTEAMEHILAYAEKPVFATHVEKYQKKLGYPSLIMKFIKTIKKRGLM